MEQYLVMTGGIRVGYHFFGPFDSQEEAQEWGDEYRIALGVTLAQEVQVLTFNQPFDIEKMTVPINP